MLCARAGGATIASVAKLRTAVHFGKGEYHSRDESSLLRAAPPKSVPVTNCRSGIL